MCLALGFIYAESGGEALVVIVSHVLRLSRISPSPSLDVRSLACFPLLLASAKLCLNVILSRFDFTSVTVHHFFDIANRSISRNGLFVALQLTQVSHSVERPRCGHDMQPHLLHLMLGVSRAREPEWHSCLPSM